MADEQVPSGNSDDSGVNYLVGIAKEQGEPDSYAGKRTWTRYRTGMRLDVTNDPTDPSVVCSAIMENVSVGGCSFWTKRRLPQDTRVFVREFPTDEETEWLPAAVHHCTVGIRGFLVGVAFDDVPAGQAPQNDMQACHSEPVQHVPEVPPSPPVRRGLGGWFRGENR